MVFDWFFGSKGRKSRFEELLKELEKIAVLDEILEKLILDKGVDENSIRNKVDSVILEINSYLREFNQLFKDQNLTLRLYITTSVKEVDYIQKIETFLSEISSIFKTINKDFHKDDFLTFVDETIKLRNEFKKKIVDLETEMKLFQIQSKCSLEWNYEAGSNNIDERDFKSKVKSLGGIIDDGVAKGSHYLVKFRLFENTIGPSRRNVGQISGGTLSAFINQRENMIKPYLDPKYLKCFFFKNKKTFLETFENKYKHLFKN